MFGVVAKIMIPQLIDHYVIGNTINSQGLAFMEFLEDIDYCMLNGRFRLESNKYTSLLHRGSAVVDYCVTSTSNIMLVQSFKITLVHDFLDKCHIPVDGNIPDHSILFWEIKCQNISFVDQISSSENNAHCSINGGNGMVASALQVNADCFENIINIKLENNDCSDILTKVHNWSKTIDRLNKKNWVWKCMKIMCNIKGIDTELAFCGELIPLTPSYSQ